MPEVDQINFAPRVRIPVLMLNGRFDFFFPVDTSQHADVRDARHAEGAEAPPALRHRPRHSRLEMIKETLDWLDRYQ